MDTSSTSHLTNEAGNLSNFSRFNNNNYILVGDDTCVPILGHENAITCYLNHPFRLNNVYDVPNIIKNLVFVKKFNHGNNKSIEFDSFGFTLKDLITKIHITQCDSPDELYPLTPTPSREYSLAAFHTMSPNIWHNCLGHPTISNFNYFSFCFSLGKKFSYLLMIPFLSLIYHLILYMQTFGHLP